MRFLRYALAAALAASLMAGCAQKAGGPEQTSGADAGKPHIVFVFKVMGIPYADSLAEGVKRANEELGVKAEIIGPTTGNDIQGQVNMIMDQIARKVDAIVISANDANSVKPAMDAAKKAGIKVYTWDSDSPGSGREFYVAGCDDVQIGRDVAKRVVDEMGGKGKIAIMTGTLTANNLRMHVDGANEELKKHPGITVVDPLLACNDQKDQAIKGAISMLQKTPDLGGFVALCSPAAPGIAEALMQTGKVGKVKVWGISLPSEVRDYIKKGAISGALLWNPADMTYATAMLVRDHVKSGKMPVDGQEIPGVGKIKVTADQAVIPGVVISKDTVDTFDF